MLDAFLEFLKSDEAVQVFCRKTRLRHCEVTLLDASEWRVIVFTLGTCALSLLLILPFGLVLAWLLRANASRQDRGGDVAHFARVVIPPVATGLLLQKLFVTCPSSDFFSMHFI